MPKSSTAELLDELDKPFSEWLPEEVADLEEMESRFRQLIQALKYELTWKETWRDMAERFKQLMIETANSIAAAAVKREEELLGTIERQAAEIIRMRQAK
jgi:uncharacterized protein YhaN